MVEEEALWVMCMQVARQKKGFSLCFVLHSSAHTFITISTTTAAALYFRLSKDQRQQEASFFLLDSLLPFAHP